MDAVYRPRNTAHNTWSSILGLFLNNSLQHAVYAQQEFHSLYQGKTSIDEYCGRLKKLSDTLFDVGAAVTDNALVINTLRGPELQIQSGEHCVGCQEAASHLPLRPLLPDARSEADQPHVAHGAMEASTALLTAGNVNTTTGKTSNPPSP